MKIVNLETFRSLPNGTVFSKYEPCYFDGLKIKVDTWDSDFLYQDLIGNIDADSTEDFTEKCDSASEDGNSIPLDFQCSQRDGLFEKNQLFAVYEKDDLIGLIIRLEECRSAYNNGINSGFSVDEAAEGLMKVKNAWLNYPGKKEDK